MRRAILVGFVLLLFGKAAFGQHLGELSANYSYMHYVPVDNLPTINLNGGGGVAVLYFAGFFGLKAEVEGYASQSINFSFPPGSIRCPSGCSGTAEASLFTGNFGPTIKIRIKRVQPFFEGLVGGGIDFELTSHLAIRPIEADYFLTRFINNLTTGHNNQNNFRYQAGLVFEF
jgi:hypothetical protein